MARFGRSEPRSPLGGGGSPGFTRPVAPPALGGAISSGSSLSATARLFVAARGDINSASVLSAAPSVSMPVAGAIASNSTLSATLASALTVSGAMSAASSLGGVPVLVIGASGDIQSGSVLAATPVMAIGLSGGILSTSTLQVVGTSSAPLLLLPIPPQWLQIGYSPQYTYLLGDARTGQVIAELPLWSVSFDRRLKAGGSFRGSLTLGDPRITNTGWLTALDEGRTKIWVDRDGQLLWDGIAWTSGYSSETRVLDIGGSETWSYLTHRFVHDSLAFTQVDQLAIVRDLLAYAQGRPLAYATGAPLTFPQPGGNVNIGISNETSGVLRNLSINWWDYQAIDDVISKLAALDNGFDYSVDAAYALGQPSSMLNLSWPRRGSPAQSTGLVFAYGEAVIDYVWRRDGTQRAFTTFALGQGSGEKMLHSTASVTSWIDNGFPALERVSSHKDIDDPARLTAIATSEAAAFAKPIDLVTLIVNPRKDPTLGTFTVGDDVRLQITDERFPNPGLGGLNQSLDTYMRITGFQVTPSDSGPERVEVSLGATLV